MRPAALKASLLEASGLRSGGGGVSLGSGRAAEGSEVRGEKRSSGKGAGVSGGRESDSVGDRIEAILSCCFLGGGTDLTGRGRSLALSRSRDFLGSACLKSPISALSSGFEAFTGEVTGSVFTLSAMESVHEQKFKKKKAAHLGQELAECWLR